jgi:D-beta-D-heptose 7-phosphate kinase/D-beta-D-heptose 1-phosphate adenosyltransferase
VKPDVLIKGEDYRGKTVVGREDAGRVELAPLLPGMSTSEILRKIRNNSTTKAQSPQRKS